MTDSLGDKISPWRLRRTQRLEELQAEEREVVEYLRVVRAQIAAVRDEQDATAPRTPAPPYAGRRPYLAAIAYLEQMGRKCSREELIHAIIDSGAVLGTKDPSKSARTCISANLKGNKPRLTEDADGMIGLPEWEISDPNKGK